MSRILFAWELGTGFGHIMPYLDLADALEKRGHTVFFASRDLANAESVYGKLSVTLVQSPALYKAVSRPRLPGHSYVDVLHNAGCSDQNMLRGRLKAWRFLMESIKPDVAVFDAAPVAALVARSMDCLRITSGTGFFIPPPVTPVPALRYWLDESRLPAVEPLERAMLDTINRGLEDLGRPTIDALHRIVESNEQFLMNFQELDHYPGRVDGDYIGTFPPRQFGEDYDFNGASGQKVFAYLYPFKTLPSLFETMKRMSLRAIIYAPRVGHKIKQRFGSDTMQFVDRPANINRLLAECDACITNGSLSSSASVLLAGKPLLALPTTLERQIVSVRARETGAALAAPQLKPAGMAAKLEALLSRDHYTEAASRFAARHAGKDKSWQLEQMLARLEGELRLPSKRVKTVHQTAPANR